MKKLMMVVWACLLLALVGSAKDRVGYLDDNTFAFGPVASVQLADYTAYRDDSGTPQSVMLSYYAGPDTRGFVWQTATNVTSGTVWLRKGDYASSGDIVGQSDTTEIAATSYVHGDSNCTVHNAHTASLDCGLWSYCLGDGDKTVCGQFAVRSAEGAFTAVNVSDIQTQSASKLGCWGNVVDAACAALPSGFDFILSGGDYVDGIMTDVDADGYVQWGVITDTARSRFGDAPWIMACGNHESLAYTYFRYEIFKELVSEDFAYRSDLAHVGCHAFRQGGAAILTLPYYNNGTDPSDGAVGEVPDAVVNWLESELDAAADADWRIVMLHAGPYTTGDHEPSETFLKQMTPIFAAGKVDLVLQAHDHTYSRTLPYRWTGAGYCATNESLATLATVVNLAPATTNVAELAGVPCYLDPEGTFYVSAGCAGHRVGEMLDRAVDTGDLSFTTRPYRLVTDTVKVGSAYAEAGSLGSKDVGMPMFAVLKVDGGLLTYDWYVAETNGTATLFDTLRICKTGASPSDQPVSYIDADGEEKWKCAGEFDVVTAETRTLTNGWYVVKGSITIPEEANLTVNGTAHLILCDGAELTASAVVMQPGVSVSSGNALSIYGQAAGTGKLTAGGGRGCAGIGGGNGGGCGTVTICGGTIVAQGGEGAADIGGGFNGKGGTVTINGGNVRANMVMGLARNSMSMNVYCVTVKWEEGRGGSEEGREGSLKVEGLSEYGTKGIMPVDGRVYLWLPDGTHWFTVSDGTTTHRYCAAVKGRAITVEPLGPIGFFVNGVDIGEECIGDGWKYQNRVLMLYSPLTYVLSGVATNNEVQVRTDSYGATVVLSNAVVFTEGRPALVIDAQPSVLSLKVSLKMAGGMSYLAATNESAVVSVPLNAVLTVDLAQAADPKAAMIGIFNNGDAKAIDGTGLVKVKSGLFFVWADVQAVATPDSFTCDDVAEMMMTGETPDALTYAEDCTDKPCVLVGPGVTVTVKDIPHVTDVVVSNRTERIPGATGEGGTVYRVMQGDDVFVCYRVEAGYTLQSPNPLVFPAIEGDIVVDANTIPVVRPVPYRTWNETTRQMEDCECDDAVFVTAETTAFENGKWYAVTGTVSCGTITVDGAAHLILCDGAELTAGAITDGALAVYGQPSGCGALNVSGTVSASLTCEGGILSARTLAGDSLAVVGGTVMADQTDGAVTIDGGNVRTGACESQPKNGSGNIVHCVTVKCEGLVGSVSVEGLGGYGTNDIYPIGDWVYLWLPDGTYRFSLSDGETTSRYRAVVNGKAITVAPLVPITPGTPVGPYTTPEEAENVANRAVVVPSTEVSEALGTDAARGTYCNMFGFDVVSTSDGKWAVAAGLTPEGWTNVALSVQAATRQIPVADIAALEMGVETNVTVKGCGVPGFYYSLYSGNTGTNLVAVADEEGRNVLCAHDKQVEFSGVTKPSDAAGFFSVGVKETGDVQPSDRVIVVPAPEKIRPVDR